MECNIDATERVSIYIMVKHGWRFLHVIWKKKIYSRAFVFWLSMLQVPDLLDVKGKKLYLNWLEIRGVTILAYTDNVCR